MDIGDVSGEVFTWDAATAVTTAVDLWEFVMTSGYVQRVGGIALTQTTDLGDAQHEILNFAFVWGNTTSGSGGGTPSRGASGIGVTASGFSSYECRNTTQASGGTPGVLGVHGWNLLSPLLTWFPNGLEPRLIPTDGGGELNVVRLLAAPADSVTMHSSIWVRAGAQVL